MPDLSQKSGSLNISLTKGDTFSMALDFPIDLTGYTFDAKVGSVAMTVTPVELASGKINLSLTASQTAAFTTQPIIWYLKWTNPGGGVRTVLSGKITYE